MMSDMEIYRHSTGKVLEHEGKEPHSACDQQQPSTDTDDAFESRRSLAVVQYAFPPHAVEHADEPEGNCKERGQLHGGYLMTFYHTEAVQGLLGRPTPVLPT